MNHNELHQATACYSEPQRTIIGHNEPQQDMASPNKPL